MQLVQEKRNSYNVGRNQLFPYSFFWRPIFGTDGFVDDAQEQPRRSTPEGLLATELLPAGHGKRLKT